MQPGVTVVLAMVWLVCASMVGTSNPHSSGLTLDQYSPLTPQQRHGVYRRVTAELDWKNRNRAEFDLSNGVPRSMSTSPPGGQEQWTRRKHPKGLQRRGNKVDETLPLHQDESQDYNKAHTDEKDNAESSELPWRDPPPPSGLEDTFVADETFQDQGPGSVEIYRLDLLREKSLLSPTPMARHLARGKGKAPKKTSQVNWKVAKGGADKATSPFYKQSNSFDDASSEIPPNTDPFSIGGVPELQVGCEGLEASDHSKQKRSIDKDPRNVDLWTDVTPVSLDLDYDVSGDVYEEMDELLKLRKLETTTRGVNRGDMEATLHSDFFDEKSRAEKLPVRGDLGKANSSLSSSRSSGSPNGKNAEPSQEAGHFERPVDSLATRINQRRRLLWLDVADNERRIERDTWGFGEDEGVVSSDELQTENQRRRQAYELKRKADERRRLEEARRRDYIGNQTKSDIEKIRQDYEKSLELRRKQEEERRWRLREMESKRNRWTDEERRRLEASQGRQEEEQRKRQLQREEEERGKARSRWDEELKRRQEELDRKEFEQRQREWLLKRQQDEEEARRRESRDRYGPSNLSRPDVNRNKPHSSEAEGRTQWNLSIDRQSLGDLDRRRQEEEQKLRDYIRHNQPVRVSTLNDSSDRSWQEYVQQRAEQAGRYDRPRYSGSGNGRRNHGPSAPTNIQPRDYADEAGGREATRRSEERRMRERQDQLRRDALRREEEARRIQSRKYEEERKRLEAARFQAQRRAKEWSEMESGRGQAGRTGTGYGDRRRFEEHRRREDTSLVPANLLANEFGRAAELQRQRQEQERQRLELERAKTAREEEEQQRVMKEQRRRQEEERLNALPVSARIIVHPASSSSPNFVSRAGFDIDFQGANPYRPGVEVPNFPAPATPQPVESPPPCVWAVVQCCPSSVNRLVTCFESMGCPGVNWDPNPCRSPVTQAAHKQVMQFYADTEAVNRRI